MDRAWLRGFDDSRDAQNMAATSLGLARLPIARSAVVDPEFGGTIAARKIKVAGGGHFLTGSYLVMGPDLQTEQSPAFESSPRATSVAHFGWTEDINYVIVSERTLAPSANVSAATMSRITLGVAIPSFYPELPVSVAQYWWTGAQPSSSASVKLRDRRLEPFFNKLDGIDRGEWDALRGTRPSAKATANARSVLTRLSGGAIVPRRVVAADARIVLYFTTGEKYSNVEILNTGAMLLLNSDGHNIPEVKRFSFRSLASILDQIRAHLA